MKLAITTRGYKAPERIKTYLIDKMRRLDRFSELIMDGNAVLSYEKQDQIVEFKIKLKHKMIVVKERSEDVFKSIDLGIDNLERQIARAKERLKEHDNQKIVESLQD
ncbi:MAG TPA: ribosome-associated translation inhibitor RaiA [Caldithrix abyssi]|uniref:Ribosome-associated translation inhibitor RaiA n=1 Tax=Caldithrix abyssi TaxID=187145 RepID=A0A7V1PU86_CALAY|nr:ribosome-associated translation inhibitor RaiA [Caldithrix abyssi]